jgi:hypothetical protein
VECLGRCKGAFVLFAVLCIALIISWAFVGVAMRFESLPFFSDLIVCVGIVLGVWLVSLALEKYPSKGLACFLEKETKSRLTATYSSEHFLSKILRFFSPRAYVFELLEYPFSASLYLDKTVQWHLEKVFFLALKTLLLVGACLLLINFFDVDTFNLAAILGVIPLLIVSFFCPVIFGVFFVMKALIGGVLANAVLKKNISFCKALAPVFLKTYIFCFIQNGIILILFTVLYTPTYFRYYDEVVWSKIIGSNLMELLAFFMFAQLWLKLIKPMKTFLGASGFFLALFIALSFLLLLIHYPKFSTHYQPYSIHPPINYYEMQREYNNAIH